MDMATVTVMDTATAMAMTMTDCSVVLVHPRERISFRSVATCAAAALIGFPVAGTAGDWKLDDSVSARATYVDRSGGSSKNGLVLQVSPRISLQGESAKSKADINYRLTMSQGFGTTDPDRLSHNLVADGEVELIDDFFVLGGNATAQLVGNAPGSGPVDSINVDSTGRQSYSVQLTPQFHHHLSQYADIVSNNAIDYVGYSGSNVNGDDSSGSYTANIGVLSGRYFGVWNWSLNATRNETHYSSRDDVRSSYIAGLGYRVDAKLAVRGEAGYENNDILTTRSDTDGPTWKVGFDWNPNPRTSVNADYGQRYLGTVYSGAIKHQTRRTRLSLDFSRDIANRRTEQLYDQFFFVLDPSTGGVLVDPITGDPVLVNIPEQRQVDEDYLVTQIRAGLAVSGRRTTLNVTAVAATREYEVSSSDEDTFGLTATLDRQLGTGLSGFVQGAITTSDVANGADSDTYSMQVGLRKNLSPRTSASVDLLHRNHDSSTANGDYDENRITFSVSTSFL